METVFVANILVWVSFVRKKNATKSVSIENVGGSLDNWHLEGRRKIKYFFKQNFSKWNKFAEKMNQSLERKSQWKKEKIAQICAKQCRKYVEISDCRAEKKHLMKYFGRIEFYFRCLSNAKNAFDIYYDGG